MQPDENNENNMNTLNTPAEDEAPDRLSTSDSVVINNQSTGGEQSLAQEPVGQQSNPQKPFTPKKSNKGLIISFTILLILLIVGILVAVVMINSDKSDTPVSKQPDASEEVVEDEDDGEETEVVETRVSIDQVGTAEVENGTFSIKDQSGTTVVKDDVMNSITGVKLCETANDGVQVSIRCIVSTENGEGIYVYYPDDGALKYADQ